MNERNDPPVVRQPKVRPASRSQKTRKIYTFDSSVLSFENMFIFTLDKDIYKIIFIVED